ncbi:hypothetical protein ACIPY5_08230 [Microbacterium sp. NPDC089698]|uniref:hypothetical protein n=1 Tax=Microbacterium sp. NPDC089698 TaxID=3364200 RepID=UPI00381E3915
MGYRIRVAGASSTRSRAILLLVAALIAGLLGMHVLDGHGSPAAGADPASHAAMPGAPMAGMTVDAAVLPAEATMLAVDATVRGAGAAVLPARTDDDAGPGHGCADCAEHAAMAEACVLAPAAPAVLPGPPAEDLRPAIGSWAAASAANDPADPRPPRISELCISRR